MYISQKLSYTVHKLCMLTQVGFSGKSQMEYISKLQWNQFIYLFSSFIPAAPRHVSEAALRAALLKIHVHSSYD